MNPQLQSIVDFVKTERMQVILILMFVLLSAFLTINFVVLKQFDIKEQHQNQRQEMDSNRYASQSTTNMNIIASHERANLLSLSNEWAQIAEHLTVLQTQVPTSIIGYNVQLFEVRDRLQKKSEELKIGLVPTEFMDDTLTSDEDIRTRILQLNAVELLADMVLDNKIHQLVEIYPLTPIQHVDQKGQKTFSEYPVRVECDVDFTHLYSFFQSVFEKDRVFTFRNIRIESGSTLDAKLRVKAILSALLFD